MQDAVNSRRRPLYARILCGLIVGLGLGLIANVLAMQRVAGLTPELVELWGAKIADPLGQVFLRLIFMVVIPLVLSALALGVAELGDPTQLGRIGLRTLLYTGIFSTCAVGLGVGLVNTLRPGHALPVELRESLMSRYSKDAGTAKENARKAKSLSDTLLDIIPKNPLQEMVGALDGSSPGNGMLSVMFFALALGLAITRQPDKCSTLINWLEGLNAISMEIIGFAMKLAPFAVGCLVFSLGSRLGLSILLPLLGFFVTVVLGLVLQAVVVYPIALWWNGGLSPGKFFRGISEAMLTALGTSSSNATLPTALKVAEENLHLPRDVSRFVLTVGATANQNGTALYEGVVVLFLAQVFHVDLTLWQQITVVLMSVLAGIGTAGVPGGSLPLIVVVMQSVGIPGEGIGIILGIDRILDMCRTVLNVTGDLAIAACVSHASYRMQSPTGTLSAEGKDFAEETT